VRVTGAASDEADRRFHVTVGLVVLLGLSCVAWAAWTVADQEHLFEVSWLRIIGFAAIVGLAVQIMLAIRIKDSKHGIVVQDAVLLVGFALLPGPWLVLSTAVGVATAKIVGRTQPVKVVFNAAKDTTMATAAVLAGAAFGLSGPFTANLHDLDGIAAAAAAILITDDALMLPLMSALSRIPVRTLFLKDADVRIGTNVLRMALAGASLFFISRSGPLVIVVPIVIIGLHVVAANQVRAREERAAWQKLAQATDEFNEIDLDGVLHSAVARAAELFSCDEVEVEVVNLPTPDRLIRGNATRIRYDGSPTAAPPAAPYSIATPLEGHQGGAGLGELRLRFRSKVKLTEREEYTLRTFAAALCTALRNGVAFTESRRLSDEHEFAAAHDPLTGLANRRRLYELGAAMLAEGGKGQSALLLIDLNHFKEINDTLGHSAGDHVLREVAARLAAAAQADDLVVRLGGDEFAVLFTAIPTPALAVPRARAVLAVLDAPIEVDGMRVVVEASTGLALAPFRGGLDELLRRADVAMYQAKREGRPIALYARARDTADVGRLALSAELPRAIAEREFAVLFQPVVDLGTGEVLSAEALARWHHPDRGDLNPIRFLDYVERSGLLSAFSQEVLAQALTGAATWRAAGFDLPVAVNVSPRSLLDPSFPALVQDGLTAAGLTGEALVVELTESLTLSQLDVVDEALTTLRELGVRLALDDFGTGYSSLATLARVQVHELKIDRAFIAAMDGSAEAAVVRSTIDLGRSLGLQVVAEGVESEDQRMRLWELGCPAGQGHLFARPLTLPRIVDVLRRGYEGRTGAVAAALHEAGSVIRLPARRPTRRHDETG
jgi:diguanylate cyclase (GGDEF)-like protein